MLFIQCLITCYTSCSCILISHVVRAKDFYHNMRVNSLSQQALWCTSSLPPSSITCLLVEPHSTTRGSRTRWEWWVRSTKGTMWWGRGQCRLTDPHSKVYPSECVCRVCKLWVLVFLLPNPPSCISYSCSFSISSISTSLDHRHVDD